MHIRRNRIQLFSKPQQHPNCFYGVDSEMLSSEKSIFENYDCGDRHASEKNAAVMVKTMHPNGLHDILPVLYKVASILATIPATSCSAERSFSALHRIKTFVRSTMGQDRLSSIAVINTESRKYANRCRMTCKLGLLTYLGVEVIVLHTSLERVFISHFMFLYLRHVDLD